jgi:hypothetical protein
MRVNVRDIRVNPLEFDLVGIAHNDVADVVFLDVAGGSSN